MLTRYVVRSPSGALRPLLGNGVALAVFALVVGVLQDRWRFVAAVVLIGGVVTLRMAWRGWTRLSVDAAGVTLSVARPFGRGGVHRRTTSWGVLDHLVVVPATETVRIVPRHDLTVYERRVPGLDVAAFDAAVRQHSPTTPIRRA